MTTIAKKSENDLVYTINSNAANFGWGLTEDGQGIVIWDDTGFQILPANVQLQFSDKTVDTSSLFSDDDNDGSVHLLSGSSSDWGWGLTEDGKGIVVWNDDGSQILPANVQLQFSDRTVDTSILFGDGSVHTLAGSSSDWGWDVTEDGEGVVVWSDTGFEILPASVKLQFADKTVDTSYLFEDTEPPAELGSVGGKVWFDENQNGFLDNGEGGYAGLRVKLQDSSGNLIEETVSDSDGNYQFDELAAGDYMVSFWNTSPFHYFTEKHVAGNAADMVDSDVNVVRISTDVFTLGAGPHNDALNAGIIEFGPIPQPDPDADLGSISGRVWVDDNNDGLQSKGEGGFAHIRVQLKGSDGKLIYEAQTDPYGKFTFEHLIAGDYTLTFRDTVSYEIDKAPFEFVEQDVAGNTFDRLDSDVNFATSATDVLTLGAGEHIDTIGAGLYLDGFINFYAQPSLTDDTDFELGL